MRAGLEMGEAPGPNAPKGLALHGDDLTVSFADSRHGQPFRALDKVSLACDPGRLHVVTGPSGSGKSTLLYMIAGLMRPDEGEVRWADVTLSALGEARRDAWRRRHVGFVFQSFHLIPELNALDNVLTPVWFGQWRAGAFADRATSLLEDLNVPLGRGPARHMSRGEQQRVAFARALIFDPPIILADEPTASLDLATGETVIKMLRDMADKDGRTVIAISHDPTLIDAADSLITMRHGAAASRGGALAAAPAGGGRKAAEALGETPSSNATAAGR